MRSATISFSEGCISVSSIVTPFISPLPESLTVTRPPPETPSTSIWSSSACIASILDLSSVACFIRPRKSAIDHLLPRALAIELLSLKLVVGRKFRVLGIGRRQVLGRSRAALAHVNDLGARKAREYRLHQRVRLDVGLERGLPRVILRSNRRLALLCRYDDHPAPVGPLRELARQIVDQRLCRARLQCDLQPTVLAAHQPHVALERELDAEVALLRRQRDQILEPADGQRGRTWRCLGQTRAHLARGRQRCARRAARDLAPRRLQAWRRGGRRRSGGRSARARPACVLVE